MKADSLRAGGRSTRAIAAKLRQKGLGAEVVQQQLTRVRAEIPDEEAARTLARKRRLGPFRRPGTPPASKEKELAVLARAGFSYSVARRVLEGDGPG
jgi:regulatory protein